MKPKTGCAPMRANVIPTKAHIHPNNEKINRTVESRIETLGDKNISKIVPFGWAVFSWCLRSIIENNNYRFKV